jgi:hypothetical protein
MGGKAKIADTNLAELSAVNFSEESLEITDVPWADEVPNMTANTGALTRLGVEALLDGKVQATPQQLAQALSTQGRNIDVPLRAWLEVQNYALLGAILDELRGVREALMNK